MINFFMDLNWYGACVRIGAGANPVSLLSFLFIPDPQRLQLKKDIFAQSNCTIREFDLCIEPILTLHTRKCLAQGHPSLWPVLGFQPSGSETHSCLRTMFPCSLPEAGNGSDQK